MADAMDADEYVMLKRSCAVYKIPPASSSQGHKADDWVDCCWQGKVLIAIRGEPPNISIQFRDTYKNTLFAKTEIPHGTRFEHFVERAFDSTRAFAIKVADGQREAFLGLTFEDRNDAFDFNVMLNDLAQQNSRESAKAPEEPYVSKDRSMRDGEKLSLNIKGVSGKKRDKQPAQGLSGLGGLGAAPESRSRRGAAESQEPAPAAPAFPSSFGPPDASAFGAASSFGPPDASAFGAASSFGPPDASAFGGFGSADAWPSQGQGFGDPKPAGPGPAQGGQAGGQPGAQPGAAAGAWGQQSAWPGSQGQAAQGPGSPGQGAQGQWAGQNWQGQNWQGPQASAAPEKRRAPDGGMYTREVFVRYYGGTKEWDAAPQAQPAQSWQGQGGQQAWQGQGGQAWQGQGGQSWQGQGGQQPAWQGQGGQGGQGWQGQNGQWQGQSGQSWQGQAAAAAQGGQSSQGGQAWPAQGGQQAWPAQGGQQAWPAQGGQQTPQNA